MGAQCKALKADVGKARQNETSEPTRLKGKVTMRRCYNIWIEKCYSKNTASQWYAVFCKDSFYQGAPKTLAQFPLTWSGPGFHSVSSKIFSELNNTG